MAQAMGQRKANRSVQPRRGAKDLIFRSAHTFQKAERVRDPRNVRRTGTNLTASSEDLNAGAPRHQLYCGADAGERSFG